MVKLDVYRSPWELERAIGHFVEHYNHRQLHEALQNATPADVYAGRQATILVRKTLTTYIFIDFVTAPDVAFDP